MDSTKNMWRRRRGAGLGLGHRPMGSFSQRDDAQHFKLPDDQLTGITTVGTGLAVHHEAAAVLPISYREDVLELRSNPMSKGQMGDSSFSSCGAKDSSTETRVSTGCNVERYNNVLASFHKSFSEEKWEVEPLDGVRDMHFGAGMKCRDNSNYEILPGVHQGTGSEADKWSAALPKICETGSSSTEYFSNPDGQEDAPEAANQTSSLNNPQPTNSVNPINNFAAEYTPSEKKSDLFRSATWTVPTQQWPLEDDLMIYNLHAKQWLDDLIFLNHHQAFAQEDHVATPTEVHELAPDLKERPSRIPKSKDNVHKSFVKTMSDIDVATESFSFWPEQTSFYSCPPSPSMWPGSRPVQQPSHQGSHSYTGNATRHQTLKEVDFSLLTETLRYTTAENPEVEAEACDSSGTWFESCGDLSIYSMSRRDEVVDPISTNVHVDTSSSIYQGISADQETTEKQQSVFPDSLELPQEQDNNQSGDSAVPWLQEHASDLLLHNSKRDRTNSIQIMSKPTSALRKKKQKDEEIPEGRLTGTSVCTDPNLCYGLAAVQNLLKDFHGSAGFTLKAKELDHQRPQIPDLLDAELETLCIGDNLGPENKTAVFAVLKRGRGKQAATDSDLVQHILDLKMRLVSLLEESRSHESSTLTQLKDTVSRYAFLFPTSATDAFTKRLIQSNQYLELESVVCQNFRESKIFRRPSPSTASSSSRRLGNEYSSDEASMPSVYSNVRGQIPVEALGEVSAGTPPPNAEKSERTGITSRRDLSGARGNLPRLAAEFMRKWLFENFDNPNPSREEKLSIASQFNITEKQVTNHFVNLRARKYRPLLRSLNEDSRPEDKENGQGEKTEEQTQNQMSENLEAANRNEVHHSTRNDHILERRH